MPEPTVKVWMGEGGSERALAARRLCLPAASLCDVSALQSTAYNSLAAFSARLLPRTMGQVTLLLRPVLFAFARLDGSAL